MNRLTAPDSFIWATGIEDTFITDPWPGTGRTLDEYELTDHYSRWREDFALMSELGVGAARYGIPWHRVNPEANRWDWSWADRTLGKMLELGIDPIVDLVHYGAPAWLEGSFLNPDYPRRIAEYAARLAERFKGRVHWYTPLNEPRIAAWYCGKLGWWPPYHRNWRGFLEVMLGIVRGVLATCKALRSVDPEIVAVHVDATDLYYTLDASLKEETARRQQIVFIALDLLTGQVDERHKLWRWLLKNGVSADQLLWFREHKTELDIVGINMYPMFTVKELFRSRRGMRVAMRYGDSRMVERLVKLYYERYRRPIMITETASLGSVRRRLRWLDESVGAVRRLRSRGVPLIGYTWWPMFSLVGWAYRQGRRATAKYFLKMGLWDLDTSARGRLQRVRTPLVDAYRKVVAGGAQSAGLLKQVA